MPKLRTGLLALLAAAILLVGCGVQTSPVTGVVVDSDEQPVAGATVTLAGKDVATDENGAFRFDAVRHGSHKITVSVDGETVIVETIRVQRNMSPLRLQIPEWINVALGASYTYNVQPANNYPDPNGTALTDGQFGTEAFQGGGWVGIQAPGEDWVITLDLGSVKHIGKVEVGYLQNRAVGIRVPKTIALTVSTDGEAWTEIDVKTYNPETMDQLFIERVVFEGIYKDARYVRLTQEPGVSTGWTFIDEIMVYASN